MYNWATSAAVVSSVVASDLLEQSDSKSSSSYARTVSRQLSAIASRLVLISKVYPGTVSSGF